MPLSQQLEKIGEARNEAIRRKLGFLKVDDDIVEDLVDVGDLDDGVKWIPMTELVCRSEQGRWYYSLWRINSVELASDDEPIRRRGRSKRRPRG